MGTPHRHQLERMHAAFRNTLAPLFQSACERPPDRLDDIKSREEAWCLARWCCLQAQAGLSGLVRALGTRLARAELDVLFSGPVRPAEPCLSGPGT